MQVQRKLRKSVREPGCDEAEAEADAHEETKPKRKPKAKAKTKAASKRKAEKAAPAALPNERKAEDILSEALELEQEEEREKNELREEDFEEKKKGKKKGKKNKEEHEQDVHGVKRRLDFDDCVGADDHEHEDGAGEPAGETHDDDDAKAGLGACTDSEEAHMCNHGEYYTDMCMSSRSHCVRQWMSHVVPERRGKRKGKNAKGRLGPRWPVKRRVQEMKMKQKSPTMWNPRSCLA